MLTKTVRSRFDHAVGEKVEGCVILERKVIIPPNPVERRLGVYDYLVEVPPAPVKPVRATKRREPGIARPQDAAAAPESFTRATPDDRPAGLIRRLPQR
jgi:hypothetical protein